MEEITWTAPEFHYYEKNVSWYWMIFLASIIIIVIALWQGNFLFVVFAGIAVALLFFWGKKSPRDIEFTLSDKGLDIGGKKNYPYEAIAGFAIVPISHNPELKELVIKTKGRIGAILKIIIATQRADAIKAMLVKRVAEIEYEETFSDHIAKRMKF